MSSTSELLFVLTSIILLSKQDVFRSYSFGFSLTKYGYIIFTKTFTTVKLSIFYSLYTRICEEYLIVGIGCLKVAESPEPLEKARPEGRGQRK